MSLYGSRRPWLRAPRIQRLPRTSGEEPSKRPRVSRHAALAGWQSAEALFPAYFLVTLALSVAIGVGMSAGVPGVVSMDKAVATETAFDASRYWMPPM